MIVLNDTHLSDFFERSSNDLLILYEIDMRDNSVLSPLFISISQSSFLEQLLALRRFFPEATFVSACSASFASYKVFIK